MRALLVLLLAVACSESTPSDSPESERGETVVVDPATDRAVDPVDPPEISDEEAEEGEEARHFEPFEEGATIPQPAIGQWVRYGLTWRDGGRSTVRYGIVDREDGGWWVEVEDRRENRARHVRMRITTEEGERHVHALAFSTDGQIQEIPPRLVATYEPMLKQWLEILFPGPLEGEPEDITVPAGTFAGARKGRLTFEFQEQRVDAMVWRHPEVPLTGMVRFVDEGRGHTLQLLGYGLEGARSAF